MYFFNFNSNSIFCVSVYTIRCRNNASIFNSSSLSGGKVSLVDALDRLRIKISSSFLKRRQKQKNKLRKNGKFYAKSVFDKIDFGYLV